MHRPPVPSLPLAADEPATLNAFLDQYRAALLDRAWGLDRDRMNRPLVPSTLSLSRLIAHMTTVENTWFLERFEGEPEPEVTASLDWDADPDAEMTRGETLATAVTPT